MKRSLSITALVLAGAVAAAGMAFAETTDAQETVMFSEAKIDMQQALTIAMNGLDGKVSSIEFESEDGRAIYEAVAVSADGSLSEIVIDANDANDGTVIAQGAYLDDDEMEDEDRG
tara:strand:- start:98 stop:445 length:348 start_codon:yes stop_codon:yes gene_type:complete